MNEVGLLDFQIAEILSSACSILGVISCIIAIFLVGKLLKRRSEN